MRTERSIQRRSYGTGSLYIHRDGNGRETWYGRWRVGGRQVNRRVGPKRQKSLSDGLTRSQAERELRKLMESEIPVSSSTMTLVQAGERYCDHAEAKGRKRSTVMDYRSTVRVHFGSFGDKPLDAITPADVERFMRDRQREKKATKSIRNWIGILSATLNHARRQGWCSTNPCDSVELPREEDSGDIHFLTGEELKALLRAAKGNGRFAETDRVLYLTAAMTGMRQGELLALRWQDVDWTASKNRIQAELCPRPVRLSENSAFDALDADGRRPGRRARAALPAVGMAGRRRPRIREPPHREAARTHEADEALQGRARAGEAPRDPLPRPQAYVRDDYGVERRPDEGTTGMARPPRLSDDRPIRRLRARSEGGRARGPCVLVGTIVGTI